MDPILDIRPVRPGLFTYSLRAPGQPPRPSNECFDSLDQCMSDAARALLNYFERVQVYMQGLPIGTYSPVRLLDEPLRIARELQERFRRVHGEP
ncbi:MAG: hypothetical protein REJ24_13085 [Rhodocyclaceae bacterium]|nr:hypothetical protein [Pseudomonadota bacterium]MDQ7973496.1 hypothetical protein [Rhodocyclaceae bacterium]